MDTKNENVWRDGLLRGVSLYGSVGVVMMVLVLVLPGSFHEGTWNEELFAGVNKRVALFGGGLGVAWALFLLQQTSPIMIAICGLGGMFLWSLGELSAAVPPLVAVSLGLLLGWSATRDLLKEIETVRGLAGKVTAVGEERTGITNKLFETVVNTRSDMLRITAAETLRLFGRDAVDPLLKNLEHPNPKARQRIAQALGVIGEKEAIPALQILADKEQDAAVKQTALAAISRLRNAQAR